MDGLRLIPRDGMTLVALAQQVVCWARTPTGRLDGRVRVQVGRSQYLLVPAAVCAQYGAPPFTSQGQAITCPAEGEGEVPWYVVPDDVPGLNTVDCSSLEPGPGPEPLPAPVGLVVAGATPNITALEWEAVPGADGYTVEYGTGGATESVTSAEPSVNLTGLVAGAEYSVRVRATDSTGVAGESPWSEPVTFTTAAAP